MNKVLFFAQLRERLGCDTINVEAGGLTVQALKELLAERDEHWSEWLLAKEVLVAVNQVLANGQTCIEAGDEVAMFPPVTGG